MKRIRRRSNGSIAEFSPILVLGLLLLFPLINLFGIVYGGVTGFLVTRQASYAAANSTGYYAALTGMQQEANRLMSGGMAKFAKLKPVGGFADCGIDLFVNTMNTTTSATSRYGPNSPAPGPINISTNVYEYEAVGYFDVQPYLNLSGVPWIGSIPGVGVPMRLTFNCPRAVEHPEGLAGGDMSQITAALASGTLPGVGVGGGPFGFGNVTDTTTQNPIAHYIVIVPSNDPSSPGYFIIELDWSKYGGNLKYGMPAIPNASNIYADDYSMLSWQGKFVSQTTNSQVAINNQFQSGSSTGSTTTTGANPISDIKHWDLYGPFNANNTFASQTSDMLYNINNYDMSPWGCGLNQAQKDALSTAVQQMAPWAGSNGF